MKKIVTLLLTLLLGIGALAVPAVAAESPAPQAVADESLFGSEAFRRLTPELVAQIPSIELTVEEGISTYADVIETYYARNKNDGKLYKRRWNATRGYWVDKDWILVG